MLAAPRLLIAPFMDVDAPENATAVAIATTLLGIAALFQIFDASQATLANMLRGLHDSTMPLLIALLGYWAVGAPVGLVLGFLTPLGVVGVWVGLAPDSPSSPSSCCCVGSARSVGDLKFDVGSCARRQCRAALIAIARAHETEKETVFMTDFAEPLVIDVDTGIDDAFALLYACAHESCASSASPRSSAMFRWRSRHGTHARSWRLPGERIFLCGRAPRRRCPSQ